MRGERCRTAHLVRCGLGKMYRTNRCVSLVAWSQVKAVEVPTSAVITFADTRNMVLIFLAKNVLPSPIIVQAVTLTWYGFGTGVQHSSTQRCARGGDVSVRTGCTSIWQSTKKRNVSFSGSLNKELFLDQRFVVVSKSCS